MNVPRRVWILNIPVLYMEGVDFVAHTYTPHSHTHVPSKACILYIEGVYFVYGGHGFCIYVKRDLQKRPTYVKRDL